MFTKSRRRRSILLAVITFIGAILVGAIGISGYLGWFGGPVYRLIPAVGRAAPAQRDVAVVLFSGDTGFHAGMTPKVAATLATHGVPVLVVNSLTAFASRRTPDEARTQVADAVRHALALPGIRRVVLAGQSFGADMVQYGAAGMASTLRPKVVQVLLSVPGDTLLFKATPGGLLDGAPDRPALPSARAIDWTPVLCVHGAVEENSLCPLLHGRNVRIVTLPGGHHLDEDDAALSGILWQAIVQGR